MKKLLTLLLVFVLAVTFANAATGSIWTTKDSCADSTQDANHYAVGEAVWVNGAGFPEGNVDWSVTGLPGGASCSPSIDVASGTDFVIGSGGTFCFLAHTVQPGECGEYKVTFGNKHDNYRVDTTNEVPEYAGIAGGVALVGALGIFVFRRKQ